MTIKELKEQLEAGLEIICEDGSYKLKKDLTIGDLAKFKAAVSAVNDILTIAQTCAFADEIGVPEIKEYIENPNKNGFDVQYSKNDTKVLAELKATIPCGKDGKYGANQKQSIEKDLKNLSGESEKAEKYGITNLTKYKRYMVLFDSENQRKEMSKLTEEYREIETKYIGININIDKYIDCGWKD